MNDVFIDFYRFFFAVDFLGERQRHVSRCGADFSKGIKQTYFIQELFFFSSQGVWGIIDPYKQTCHSLHGRKPDSKGIYIYPYVYSSIRNTHKPRA